MGPTTDVPRTAILPGRGTPAGSGSRAELSPAPGLALVAIATALGAWLRLPAAGLLGGEPVPAELPPAGPFAAALAPDMLAQLDALLGSLTVPMGALVLAAWGGRREALTWGAAALLLAVHPGHAAGSGLGTGAASSAALTLAAVGLARGVWTARVGRAALWTMAAALGTCLVLARGLDPGAPPVDAAIGVLSLLAVGPALGGASRTRRGAIAGVPALLAAAWSLGLAREGGWPTFDTNPHAGFVALGAAALVLAPVGAVGALLRDARWTLLLTVPLVVSLWLQRSTALVHPWTSIAVCLLAAEALGALWTLSRRPVTRAAVDAGFVALSLLFAASTWTMLVSPETGRNWLSDNLRPRAAHEGGGHGR